MRLLVSQISAGVPTILNEIFRVLPQYFQEKCQYNMSNWIITASFHVLSILLFTKHLKI